MYGDHCTPAPQLESDYRRKIVNIDRLQQLLTRIRRGGSGRERPRTIVQCHGCFDIVHPGHIRYLQFARTQGDVLVVSITGDADVGKGELRPYIPQELRAENLAALEFVNYVVIDPNPTACALLQKTRPDVYVKGAEYATSNDPRFVAEREIVESGGGRVIFSSGQVVFSSSRLIEAMSHEGADADAMARHRLELLCRRHRIDATAVENLIDAMAGKRLLILGDTIVERYVLCDPMPMAGESPLMSLKELDGRDYLGGAALVAAQAASLGAEVVLVTSMGPDERSAWAAETLEESGVRVRAVHRAVDAPMRTRFMVNEQKVFKVDRGSPAPLDSVAEREATERMLDQAAHCDAAILYDAGYGMITPGVLRGLGGTFRHRVPVIAGCAAEPQGDASGLRNIDLLCQTERQLRAASNDFAGGLSSLAYRVLQATRAKQMLVELGKRGVVAFNRRSHDPEAPGWHDRLSSEHLTPLGPRVVDALGSTEALLAAGTLALASGAPLMLAAYVGSAVMGLAMSKLGLLTIDRVAVERWMAGRVELSEPDAEVMSAPLDRMAMGAGADIHNAVH